MVSMEAVEACGHGGPRLILESHAFAAPVSVWLVSVREVLRR